MKFKTIASFTFEFISIAIGAGVFVTSALTSSIDEEGAGFGAFMIVSGLLFKSWKKDFNRAKVVVDTNPEEIPNRSNKHLVAGLIFLIAFTFWGMQQGKVQRLNSEISSLQYDVSSLESMIKYNRGY